MNLEQEFRYYKWRHIENVIAQRIENYKYHMNLNGIKIPYFMQDDSKKLAIDFIQQTLKEDAGSFNRIYEEAWNAVNEEFKNNKVGV